MDLDLFEKYAYGKHAKQMYGNDKPYRYHLDNVRDIVLTLTSLNEKVYPFSGVSLLDLICVSIGHDLIEDTNATKAEIMTLTNENVANAIALISDPSGKDRAERKSLAYKAFSNYANEYVKKLAATVKLADRLANLNKCYQDYELDNNCIKTKKRMAMYIKEHVGFINTYAPYCASEELVSALNLLFQKMQAKQSS